MASKRDQVAIERILNKVDRKEQVFEKRTAFMDSDYEWGWKNTPFVPMPTEGITIKDAVTTNFAKVLARKVSNGVGYAERIIRVLDDADNEEFRDKNNAYERWCIGVLEMADERLQSGGMNSTVQGENAWNAVVRGGWIGTRAVLIKDAQGETIPDIVPIDPRNLVYEKGRGEPLWAAIITQRAKQDIRDEYPKFKFGIENNVQHPEDDDDELARVVDYYWTEDGKRMNCVIIDGQYAKKPTDTFAVNFPIVIRLIGNNPGVMNYSLKDTIDGTREIPGIEDVGDSIFAALRHVIPQVNRLASYRMALTARAVQGTLIVKSRDGTKELDQDAFASGAELGLSTDNDEDIGLLPISQLTADAGQLEGELRLDESNAGLSDPALGRLTSPVSGAALQILSQADNEVVAPFLKAVESMLAGILDNLGRQYETGRYKDIEVRGKTHTDQPFNKVIAPDDIKGHNLLSVELRQTQPQDDFALWQAAQVASQVDPSTGTALVSKQYAATKIAKVQDYDLEKRRMSGARIRASSAKYELLTQWHAARLSGEPEEVIQLLEMDIQREIEREAMEEAAMQYQFEQAVNANPMAAAAGMNGAAQQGGGAGVQDMANPATVSADPRLLAQAGTMGVSAAPSPDAGYNTTAPRNTAEAAGLEPNI
tara:strand:+ start:1754 stop:3712 length:1959 start_codon:yes stop_codon:yes gene_type:complete